MYRGKMWWRGGKTCEGADRRSPHGEEERGEEEEGEREGSEGRGRRVAESDDCCCCSCCWWREEGGWYIREKEEEAAEREAHKRVAQYRGIERGGSETGEQTTCALPLLH